MKIILSYSEDQLEAAVEYVAKNNPSFLNKHNDIRSSIFKSMKYLATNDALSSIGSMGYLITCDCEYEGIDRDENVCRIEIHVDPILGKCTENYIEEVIDFP